MLFALVLTYQKRGPCFIQKSSIRSQYAYLAILKHKYSLQVQFYEFMDILLFYSFFSTWGIIIFNFAPNLNLPTFISKCYIKIKTYSLLVTGSHPFLSLSVERKTNLKLLVGAKMPQPSICLLSIQNILIHKKRMVSQILFFTH